MRLLGGAARALGALCVALLILGLPVQVLLTRAVADQLAYRVVYLGGHANDFGGRLPDFIDNVERVRVYVTDPASPPLPAATRLTGGFDEAASSHLVDVRDVLLGARALTLAAAAIGAVLLAFALARRRYRAIAWSLTAGALVVLVVAVVSAVFGAVDFEAFFAAFHGLFFRAGTWTFPADALLIRLFPERFWATLGALWGLGVLLLGAACLIAARALRGGTDSHERVYV